jgi:hypothetical protein
MRNSIFSNLAYILQDSMIHQALRVFSATRVTERTWRMCGEDTLGALPSEDPLNPWRGTVPVPPIMDPHLDQIVIELILKPAMEDLLSKLQENMKSRSKARSRWFEIFLTIFILLRSQECNLAHQRQFARRFGIPVSSAWLPRNIKI